MSSPQLTNRAPLIHTVLHLVSSGLQESIYFQSNALQFFYLMKYDSSTEFSHLSSNFSSILLVRNLKFKM